MKSRNAQNEIDYSPLTKVPLPFIAHIMVKDVLMHFVVVYKVNDKSVEVMDPAYGDMKKYTRDEWLKIWTGNLVLLLPNDDFKTGNEKIPLSARFWELLKPHRYAFMQALVGTIVVTVLGLSMSFYVQKIIDYVLPSGNQHLLNVLSISMIAVFLVEAYLNYAKSWLVARSGVLIDIRLILGYYKHLLRLPQSFFDSMRVGEIVSRVNDAIKIRNFINEVSISFLVNVFIIVFSFCFMAIYSWKLTLIMLIMIPIYALIYVVYNFVNKHIERKVMEKSADLESQLVESLNTAGTIKRMGAEFFMNVKTEQKYIQFLETGLVSFKNSLSVSTATQIVNKVFTLVLLWVGCVYVMRQELTAGELFSLYAIVGYFTSPIAALVTMNKSIQNAKIAADRLFQIFDLQEDTKPNSQEVILTRDNFGDIVFAHVRFRYGSKSDVFEDLSFTIPQGQMVALVGESGSGKSTIAHLIQKMYPLQNGKVSVGGIDLNLIDAKSLKQCVSVVPQQIDLFSGNMIDNIALGEFEPHMERVLEVSQQAGIMSFVEKMPQGLNTYIGENGTLLSGGQKQRIAIARALYKNPELLILDEATSSLDADAEQSIQSVLDLMRQQGKTILIIAHRLSTVKNADNIIVLEKGQIIQQGNHHTLISQRGKYADLWAKQVY